MPMQHKSQPDVSYSLFNKAKKWFNQGRDGRPHATVADWNALKDQFKQQFNPVGNTREEQMASWRNIKWDSDETLDEFSYRVTQLGRALGLNDQHILDTFKLGLPSNIYVNLVHIDGMQATLNMAKRFMAVSKGPSPDASAISIIPTGIVNIVIKMVILGNTVGRCKPKLRKSEGLRRWMIEMITHQTPSTP